MGKVIAVASGKGGTGKTTTVAAVSSCLAMLGHKTLCVDFDVGLRNLDLALCMPDNIGMTFADVLSGKLPAAEACREHPKIPNLFFLSAPMDLSRDELIAASLAKMFAEIRNEFDYCLIDCPAGIGEYVKMAHRGVDLSIIVISCETPAIRAAQKTADAIRDMGVFEIQLIINRVRKNDANKLRQTVDEVIGTTGAQIFGVIPEDESIFRALHQNIPLVQYGKRFSAYSFLNVARRLTGEDIPSNLKVWRHAVKRHPSLMRRFQAEIGHDRFNGTPQSDVSAGWAKRRHTRDHPAAKEKDSLQKADSKPELFLNFFGNPELWARSTLIRKSDDKLLKVLTVTQQKYEAKESARYRMWLHDILDDNGIPYHIEVEGYWAGRRRFAEKQHIFIEEKHQQEARRLIISYNNPGNFMLENLEEEAISSGNMVAGVPQKKCRFCGREIDFDYQKCPYCKGQVVSDS